MKIWLPMVKAGTGTDVFTERLAAGLAAVGHEAVVQWFSPRLEFTPWRLSHISPPPGTDIIHTNSWQGFAFKRPGIPLVVTEHHYVGHPHFANLRSPAQRLYHALLIKPCLRRSYAHADVLVAVSHNTAAAMSQDFPSRSIVIVHNWIDTSLFCPAAVPESMHEPFRLLFVGNPARRKGSDLLPELARRLGPDFELHCLGGLRSDIDAIALPANMKTLPRTAPANMPGLYQQMDAVAILARYEAFGFVALEAMACGLPVIGFDSTGTAEVCVNQETALLTPVDDLDRVVASARQLRRHPGLRQQLGAAGRERAVAHFSEAQGIQVYLDVYRTALLRCSAPGK